MKKWTNIILGVVSIGIVISGLLVWRTTMQWHMTLGLSNYYDRLQLTNSYEMKYVSNKETFQQYKIDVDMSVDNAQLEIQLLDEKGRIIKKWEAVQTDFEEMLEDTVMEQLATVEVISSLTNDDGCVGYDIKIFGRRNYWRKIIRGVG